MAFSPIPSNDQKERTKDLQGGKGIPVVKSKLKPSFISE